MVASSSINVPPKVYIDASCIFTTVLLFTFECLIYIFSEDSGNGTVCVNKTGDTTQTVNIMIQGGKPEREMIITEIIECMYC